MAANPFAIAADIIDPPKDGALRYYDDPAGFTVDCFDWAGLDGPTDYQLANLDALVEHGRIAVRGPHGLGKTAENAWAIWWFALTRDAASKDWKAPTTASAWRQLTHYLWPEIHKWYRLLDWEKLKRKPIKTGSELMVLNLKLATGEAFAVASDQPSSIEGVHADEVLYVYDEAKSIPTATFDASEGAFSGAGADTDSRAYALAASTPGPPSGRFYEIHSRKAGLEDWHPIHVTLEDTIRAGRVSREWADQRRRQWGAKSAVYLNRVEGKFAASDEDAVVPLAWVEAAVERWRELSEEAGPLTAVAVDVARSGGDRTVFAYRHGWTIRRLELKPRQGTMDTANQLEAATRHGNVPAIIDVIGVGAGVVDRHRERGYPTVAFNAAERTDLLDSSGEFEFTNKRSAAWWQIRELLDPDSGFDLALPPDDDLVGELVAPKWRVMAGGRIQVESKDDIRKRIGRSTDHADAVIQAFWSEPPTVDEFEYEPEMDFSLT